MIYHVLPGDAQVEAFKRSGIDGEMLVCRECLVEGDISGDTLDEFFTNRAAFINDTYDDDPSNYNANVASQLRKLPDLTNSDQVNVWFEYELFCAANMWFCLDLLSKTGAAVFRVEPSYLSADDRWNGFGGATADDMRKCYDVRKRLSCDDIDLGSKLWIAFKGRDNDSLRRFAASRFDAFPYLAEVCDAATERETRPAAIIADIQKEGAADLDLLFVEFRKRAGVYGYGDSQIKRIAENHY
jgi:hypothetical protein